ncbi:MAG: hypothetical protein Kow0040_13060 [Thermogutta sp.]
MKSLRFILIIAVGCAVSAVPAKLDAREYHVAVSGDDSFPGSVAQPMRTISAAAEKAQPGDVITVHSGVHREWVRPPRGGSSEEMRIVYQAAPHEEVWIKGSEVIKGWTPEGDGVWKAVLPNTFFGDYNPYADKIVGDWFSDRGRVYHTGEVYLNGKSLFEVPSLEALRRPEPLRDAVDAEASTYQWYAEVGENETVIYAQFHDFDPNQEHVEINVRPACFYPTQAGIDYITVRGFRMSQAATQWAAPTAEQVGLIGTFWSKGWIIEDNVISHSKCTAITLGKDRASGHNAWLAEPEKPGHVVYNEVVVRAIQNGWSKERIGSHIVRNNVIHDCEQAGICGSMGCAFSEVSGNHIYNIWVKRQFDGAEIAAIKFHGAVDTVIRGNCLHDSQKGLWLDWMTQGTRVSENLFFNNVRMDLFVEVNHGPFLVDNNLFLSPAALLDMSQGGAYVHNIFAGRLTVRPEPRRDTPFFKPHSTEIVGLAFTQNGDNRFFNNIFAGPPDTSEGKPAPEYGLAHYAATGFPNRVDGNVYWRGATPYPQEYSAIREATFDPGFHVTVEEDGIYWEFRYTPAVANAACPPVNSERLGLTAIAKAPFDSADGSAAAVTSDYFGVPRDAERSTPGPFEFRGTWPTKMRLWPRD